MKNRIFACVAVLAATLPAGRAVPALVTAATEAEAKPSAPTPRAGWVKVPAGFPVDIEIVDALSSKISVHGDHFPIRLGTPIVIDGKTLVASGVLGIGEVIQGAKARAAGKAGELIITARYLNDGDITIPLGHLHIGETGRDREGTAMAVALAASSVLSLLVVGGEVVIPAGTHAIAKITQDIDLPVALTSPAQLVPPSAPIPAPVTASTAAAH